MVFVGSRSREHGDSLTKHYMDEEWGSESEIKEINIKQKWAFDESFELIRI